MDPYEPLEHKGEFNVGLNFGRSIHLRYQVHAICGPHVVLEEQKTQMPDQDGNPLLCMNRFFLAERETIERVAAKPDVNHFPSWNTEDHDRAIIAELVELSEHAKPT